MSAGNGGIPIIGHRPAMKKDNDLITMRECRAIVADECTKVHEYYLNQIPPFVARMIMDGLVHHGLIKDPRPEPAVADAAPTSGLPSDGLSPDAMPAKAEAGVDSVGGSIATDVPPSDGDEMPAVNPS